MGLSMALTCRRGSFCSTIHPSVQLAEHSLANVTASKTVRSGCCVRPRPVTWNAATGRPPWPAEASQASETVPTAARLSSRRSRRDVGAKQGLSEVTSNVDSDVESVERRSSRGSEDGGDERVSLPMPLAAVVARDRSRSNSPAISNVKVVSLSFVISSN
jgi:hypothetical protein